MATGQRRTSQKKLYSLYGCLIVALILNIAIWQFSHRTFPKWPNVPKPPSELAISSSFLGDQSLAFRVWALALQNFGNTGGNYEPLKNYNYLYLGQWFDLLDTLDEHSDFVPLLASYYFGATQTPEKQLPYVIAYLEKVGVRPEKEKWRWLAQAVYLARHRLKDMDEALRLANKLADTYQPGRPAWSLQMKALITSDMGDKKAAYGLFKAMLATEAEHMQPQEVNFMVDYICTKILTPQQAPHDPICAKSSDAGASVDAPAK